MPDRQNNFLPSTDSNSESGSESGRVESVNGSTSNSSELNISISVSSVTSGKTQIYSRILRLFVLPWCREGPQIIMLWVEWFGSLKCHVIDLETPSSFSMFSKHHEDV